ncbi:hypothetical protein ABIA39_007548 [Nocardia sp. GAS34]|uniref:hypothetical protein n=1 Tax=unclassified Nocardia TaxID=2637762 RepID=UPI003D1FBCE9
MTTPIRTPPLRAVSVMIWLAVLSAMTGCGSAAHPSPLSPTTGADLHARPSHLESTVFQGITLPVANQGPHDDDGTVATGYDRTPVGAALAAIQATVRMSVATDDQFAAIGQRMLASGPGRDAWAIARAQISISAPTTNPPTMLGYSLRSYTQSRAEIVIYTRQPDSSLTANTATVLWLDNDWKLLLPNQSHNDPVTAIAHIPADMTALTR